MDKKIGTIYETTNYDQFHYIEGNRPIVTKGVKWDNLLKSMEKKGQLIPATVTLDMGISEGQHRLEACKLLGIPYKYTYGAGQVTADDIADANSAKNWGIKDYIHFYASQTDGNSNSYKLLEALLAEFDITVSALLNTMSCYGGRSNAMLQSGKFALSIQEYEEIRRCLMELTDLGFAALRKRENFSSRAFWSAITYAWRHPMIDIGRLATIMNQNAYRIPSCGKTADLLRAISELYNYRLNKKNKVYLDTDFKMGKYTGWVKQSDLFF